MTFSFESLYYALPEFILAVAGLIIVLVVAYGGDGSDNRKRVKNLTLLSYAIALAAIYVIGPQSEVILNGLFAVTPVTHFMKLLVLLGAMAATWMVEDKWGEGLERPEYNLLVLLATPTRSAVIGIDFGARFLKVRPRRRSLPRACHAFFFIPAAVAALRGLTAARAGRRA